MIPSHNKKLTVKTNHHRTGRSWIIRVGSLLSRTEGEVVLTLRSLSTRIPELKLPSFIYPQPEPSVQTGGATFDGTWDSLNAEDSSILNIVDSWDCPRLWHLGTLCLAWFSLLSHSALSNTEESEPPWSASTLQLSGVFGEYKILHESPNTVHPSLLCPLAVFISTLDLIWRNFDIHFLDQRSQHALCAFSRMYLKILTTSTQNTTSKPFQIWKYLLNLAQLLSSQVYIIRLP